MLRGVCSQFTLTLVMVIVLQSERAAHVESVPSTSPRLLTAKQQFQQASITAGSGTRVRCDCCDWLPHGPAVGRDEMSQSVSQSLKFDCTCFRLPISSFVEMADRDIRALFTNPRPRKRQRSGDDNCTATCTRKSVETPPMKSHDVERVLEPAADDDIPSEALAIDYEEVC